MKKFFVVVLMACMAVSAWAVDLPKQGFGFQIGWAQPILRLNSPSNSMPKDSLLNVTKLNGFKLGVVYDASFIAGFGSSIGINYTFGASASNWKQVGVSVYPQQRARTLYHEVEVFVDWQYKFEVAKETYLIVYTGPSIQCGIAFNKFVDQKSIDGTVTRNITKQELYTTDSADEVLKRINVTWGIGAGFQYQRYFLRGGYEFGLINPYKNEKFTSSIEDRYTRGRLDQWSIKIGAYIWYKD